MHIRMTVALIVAVMAGSPAYSQSGYSPPIRIPTPTSPRCINASTDKVTITLRRLVTQKYGGFFTQDNKAGITVLATLNAGGNDTPKTPSVNQVEVKEEKKGQVSLPLEYPVADLLVLKQGDKVTKNVQLDLFMARTRGTNTFGDVLDVASKVLAKLPIPSNPYTSGAGKFLDFANQSIQSQTGDKGAIVFASLTLPFLDQEQGDINACMNDGFQTTGAIAVFRSTGAAGVSLLPVTNLSQQYCFRYTSEFTYELQYAGKPQAGCTNLQASAWQEVPNDYVMLIISAQKPPSSQNKSLKPGDKSAWDEQRLVDLQESGKLCDAMALPRRNCGIR
jgi:hypothetical protein